MKLLALITLLAAETGSAALSAPPTPVNVCIDHEVLWRAAAEELREWVEQADPDAAVTIRSQATHKPWVHYYLPPLESYEAARRRAHALREQGIQDVRAIRVDYLRDDEGVSLQNGVSLGKYINMAIAQQRLADLRARGLDVRVRHGRDTLWKWIFAAQLSRKAYSTWQATWEKNQKHPKPPGIVREDIEIWEPVQGVLQAHGMACQLALGAAP